MACGRPIRWSLKSTPSTDSLSGVPLLPTVYCDIAGVFELETQCGAIPGANPGEKRSERPEEVVRGRDGGGEGVKNAVK